VEQGVDKAMQIHLAQGLDPTTMTVSWITERAKSPYVVYGESDTALRYRTLSVDATTTSYTFSSPTYGNYTSQQIHHVTLKGLKPDSTYYYLVQDSQEGLAVSILFMS
jgi:hypothetical protein